MLCSYATNDKPSEVPGIAQDEILAFWVQNIISSFPTSEDVPGNTENCSHCVVSFVPSWNVNWHVDDGFDSTSSEQAAF